MSKIMPTITTLPVDEIEIPERIREVSEAGVLGLMEVIELLGFTCPIHVRRERGRSILIDGAHRLEAMKRLGRAEIPVVCEECTAAEAALKEAAGNLAGQPMDALDDALFLAAWERAYEQVHPDTKRGVAGALAKHGLQTTNLSFAELVAAKRGLAVRSVQRICKAGAGLTPDLARHLRKGAKAPS